MGHNRQWCTHIHWKLCLPCSQSPFRGLQQPMQQLGCMLPLGGMLPWSLWECVKEIYVYGASMRHCEVICLRIPICQCPMMNGGKHLRCNMQGNTGCLMSTAKLVCREMSLKCDLPRRGSNPVCDMTVGLASVVGDDTGSRSLSSCPWPYVHVPSAMACPLQLDDWKSCRAKHGLHLVNGTPLTVFFLANTFNCPTPLSLLHRAPLKISCISLWLIVDVQ